MERFCFPRARLEGNRVQVIGFGAEVSDCVTEPGLGLISKMELLDLRLDLVKRFIIFTGWSPGFGFGGLVTNEAHGVSTTKFRLLVGGIISGCKFVCARSKAFGRLFDGTDVMRLSNVRDQGSGRVLGSEMFEIVAVIVTVSLRGDVKYPPTASILRNRN